MRRTTILCPLRGALFCLMLAQGAAYAAPSSTTTEQLRVYSVGDKLMDYLGGVLTWVDGVSTRVPISRIQDKVQTAVLAHPEVRLAWQQKETASYVTREAFAGFLPQVSTNVDRTRRNSDAVQRPWTSYPAYSQSTDAVGVTARQLLYDFGAVSNRVDALKATEQAIDVRANGKQSEYVLRAMNAWHELFRARQLVKLCEMNTLSRTQIMNFIDEREKLGGSSKSDVLRARARVADAQSAEVVAENTLRAAEAAYREVFDSEPPAQLPLPEPLALDLAKYSNVSQWADKNPQLEEAKARVEAAQLEAKAAQASLLPSFFFEVSATRRDMNGGDGYVPGTDRTAGVVVKHNLYAGGAEQARKDQAEQRAREAEFELASQRRQIERAISQTLAEVRNSSASVLARREAVVVASQALGSVREQFAFRRGTLLDMLRAQEDLYIAGRDLIDGVVEHALARYRLLHLSMELLPQMGMSTSDGSGHPNLP